MTDALAAWEDRRLVPTGTRLALASRGDALTPYLLAALERRFDVVDRIDPELTPAQRLRVAALTVRPTRSAWAERFYKSRAATRMRSANAVQQLLDLPERPDVVLQVHALFDQPLAPSVLYVDCTHHQSATLWPAWNPLRGRALADWYRQERDTYESARHLFAFSEPTRRSLLEHYGIASDRVTVVGAGANLPRLPDARRGTPSGPPTILFVGNDFVRKGGEVLLDAFRRVRRTVPDARLVLVGTRPLVAPQAGVAVLGRIHDRARVAQLYRDAAALCVPSLFDPFPLVVLEAMALGVPVVTTAQMGTPEMIRDGETGRLVAPGDVDALAEALLGTLRDPAAAGLLAVEARREVSARFTWDAVVDRMAPALEALPPTGGR